MSWADAECRSISQRRLPDRPLSAMKIVLITPAPPLTKLGNRNTAQRWASLLRRQGHRVAIQQDWMRGQADIMLALHARRSYPAIRAFADRYPDRPLIVALTGTDLYRDIRFDAEAKTSLILATRLVVLQEMGLAELTPELQKKTHVIYQSAKPLARKPFKKNTYEICVIGHLREEKDPFRCALASVHLPDKSKISVHHMGRSMNDPMTQEAYALMRRFPRYHWYGELSRGDVRKRLARSRLMVISSRMEGGANVVSEALAADVPVIASRIPGNIGMLGADYEGYYPVADEQSLAALLLRAENDAEFYERLKEQCAARKILITPEREAAGLAHVISQSMEDLLESPPLP